LTIVVDASVALGWVFGDEEHAGAWRVIERLSEDGAMVPAHFHLETANGVLAALRRGRVSVEQVRTAIVALNALPIDVDLDAPSRAFSDVWPLAVQHRLTTYDAAYLELALRRQLPLATLDKALARAARAAGLAEVLE
jgi:predicted nucleic acid-binding protein